MQGLTASPRDALTTAQVEALLTGNRVEVDFGVEVLNLDLTLNTAYGEQGDISKDVRGGSVARNMDAKIHGTCRLDLSLELTWGSVLVRPYMLLSDGGVEARFNVGVYMIVTPETPVGETPATYSCQGFDRLYLLDRQVGAAYTVTSGTTYRAALLAVFTAAGLTGVQIDGAAADYTLPTTKTWALVASSTDPDQTNTPVTYLRIVNDLLNAINFRAVWCDENGLYRCQAYLEPSVRAPEYVLDADDETTTIVGTDRTVIADQWKQPNRWVFRWTNRSGGMQDVEGDGKYTYNLPASDPMSATSRGLTWTSVIDYEAASQAVLQSLGDRRVAHDRRLATTVKMTTGPLPIAGHADIVTITDTEAGISGKAQAVEWELPLEGGDMRWTFELVEA